MKHLPIALLAVGAVSAAGAFAVHPQKADATVCGRGPYRAGCAGPNGAVVGHRGYYGGYRGGYRGYYHGYGGNYGYRGNGVRGCAAGPYRAGCAGPRGAVVGPRY